MGFLPISKRSIQFIIGFFFSLLLNGLIVWTQAEVLQLEWRLQDTVEISAIVQSLWYHFTSALTEELVFRGAILYILFTRFKTTYALLITAFAFGIYHWFSYGMLGGRLVPLIYVLITTGFIGYVWGYAFVKTKSIALAFGLHVGWNFLTTLCMEATPYGELIFESSGGITPSETTELLVPLAKGLLPPLIMLLFIKLYVRKTKTEVNIN